MINHTLSVAGDHYSYGYIKAEVVEGRNIETINTKIDPAFLDPIILFISIFKISCNMSSILTSISGQFNLIQGSVRCFYLFIYWQSEAKL